MDVLAEYTGRYNRNGITACEKKNSIILLCPLQTVTQKPHGFPL